MFCKGEEVLFSFFPPFFSLSSISYPPSLGHIMLSVEPKHEGFTNTEQEEGNLQIFFSKVGKLTVTEVMGSNKALDYAVVDCFMGAYMCFLNGQ